MPRLFYPPLVEPGVYIKPEGIPKKTGSANAEPVNSDY